MKKLLALFCAGLFLVGGMACGGQDNQEIDVYTPDGAPALALAEMMSKDTKEDGVNYHVVSATGIEALVQYKDEEKNADICVLPLTDASMYLNNGEDYALLGMVTHGNFFLVSEEERVYTLENVSSLVGKKIGVVQLAKLPGLTFRYVLEREGIEYAVQEGLEGASMTKVNLINVAPTAVKPNTGFDLFLIPEPLASVKKKTGFHDAGSLQTLYGGEKGYPQAAIVAKRSLIKNNSKFIDDFVENLSSADMWLRNAEVATILNAVNSHLEEGLAPSFSDKNLSREAILGCNVYYTSAESCKTEVNDFISALQTINPNAAKSFADKFFQR